jgi:hypothetical protein
MATSFSCGSSSNANVVGPPGLVAINVAINVALRTGDLAIENHQAVWYLDSQPILVHMSALEQLAGLS